MIKLIIMAGLAFASVGLAGPAHADAGQDQEFYRLLTMADPDSPRTAPMAVPNFPLARSQGITGCQSEDAGETPYQSVKDLQQNGPYAFDDANNIMSAADTIYCPSHTDHRRFPGQMGGIEISSPVYPLPVYPLLAWYPPSVYYPPPSTTVDPGSLAVGIPISHPACDATGIVVLGSAVTPGRYDADVQRLHADNPGSSYLRTDESCPSLRQTTGAGNPIYAVYRVAGRTPQEVCSAVRVAGGNAYGKWLDNHTDPSYVIPC
jgi:hypothetical protein